MADNGRCGSKKGSSCASVFGSGWKEKGKCCRNKPCCVFHCDDIQQDQLQNGQTVNITGTEVGATATFSCKAGYGFLGNQSIEKKCQETGWSGDGILTCVGFCKNQGGNLVTIETEEENNFLKNILTLMRNAGGASENLWWWIGLTDIKTDGSFEWVSGQSVTYTDWYQGPPPEPNGVAWNNAKADCVVMRHTYGFTWSDEYCRYYDVQAICELW
ncbi:unnamed protein product [Mytilus edulis]|uniref:C-type lectin domain-containing protein n=1 Tax=Mytilus edulis TaxID=6550 RepID=A0A8S3S5N7_MYTED|nr:unnamed protein product [Mytilus edulis]